ncbi:hypothetical protein [Alkalicoccus luteus]|uniref:hypothetical protein n=1 Tax=Alkalicoccus luteus TaxID=1237094 RepID=UPI00143B3B64|nr:hypothetical protein [Alkalicoccus luteus]
MEGTERVKYPSIAALAIIAVFLLFNGVVFFTTSSETAQLLVLLSSLAFFGLLLIGVKKRHEQNS